MPDENFGTAVEVNYSPSGPRVCIFVGHGRWLSFSPEAAAELVAALNASLASCWGNRPNDRTIPARIELGQNKTA